MANLFYDCDFESGMCSLVETLAHCIENEVYGCINKRCGDFSVRFIFYGLKKNTYGVKRKADVNLCGVSKKFSKLNASIENLLLGDSTEKLIQLEGNTNLAGCSRESEKYGGAIGNNQKRKLRSERMEISDQYGNTQPKKVMKKDWIYWRFLKNYVSSEFN